MIPPDVLATIWNQHAATLLLILRVRTDAADDIVQEAFLRLAVQNSLPLDPLGWLVRVARNIAITQWRARIRHKQHEQQLALQKVNWFDPKTNESEWDSAAIQSAIELLDEECREVIVAHIWGKMTFRQIAESFEQPNSTVHRLYKKGISVLKGHLRSTTLPETPSPNSVRHEPR